MWPLGFTITFLVWTIGKNIKIRSSNHWLRLSGFSRTVSSLGLGRRCISPNPTFSYEVWTRLSLYSVLSTLMLLFFSVFITFSVVRPWKRPGFTTQSCGKFVMKRKVADKQLEPLDLMDLWAWQSTWVNYHICIFWDLTSIWFLIVESAVESCSISDSNKKKTYYYWFFNIINLF